MFKKRKKHQLEIRPNNTITEDICGFCGERTYVDFPVWTFIKGTYTPVCEACAKKCDPAVAWTLKAIYDGIKQIRAEARKDKEKKFSALHNFVNDLVRADDVNLPF